jgi:hypothetical protein
VGLNKIQSAEVQQDCLWDSFRVPGAAVHYGGDSWLVADGARAVGDGDCLGLQSATRQ